MVPKITDFGLAKQIEGQDSLTQSGAIMGTPSYMAPEQAAARKDVTFAADVYALGAILYEMLVGRPPFKAATQLQTLYQVLTDEPVPPSRLQPHLPRDLETICLKCLHKEAAERYTSAWELAEDLRRFQAGEPVLARPVGAGERLLRWARRRPALAAVYGLLLLVAVLGMGGGGAAWLWLRAETARHELDAQKQLTEAALRRETRAKGQVEKALGQAQRARGAAEKAQKEATRARDDLAQVDYLHRVKLAYQEWQDNQIARAEELLCECPPKLRRWEWRYVHRLCHADLFTLQASGKIVWSVAFSPDGRRLASADDDGLVKVWDVRAGRKEGDTPLLILRGHQGPVNSVAFSPDSQLLASAGRDTTVKVWNALTGREVVTFRLHKNWVTGVVFTADSKRVVSVGSLDRTARVWEARTGKEILSLPHVDNVRSVAISPHGRRLAFGLSYAGTFPIHYPVVEVCDARTGKPVLTLAGHESGIDSVLFSRDGKRLASAGLSSVKLWDVTPGRSGRIAPLLTLPKSGKIHGLAFSADGQWLAGGASDHTVKVWEARTGMEVFAFKGHFQAIAGLAISRDGKRLASASYDGILKVWDVTRNPELLTFKGGGRGPPELVFRPDSRRLAYAASDVAKEWDARSGQEERNLQARRGWDFHLAYSPDGKTIACASGNPLSKEVELRVWDVRNGPAERTFRGFSGRVLGVYLGPAGLRLASAGNDRTITVWEAGADREGKEAVVLCRLKGGAGVPFRAAFSRDGQRLAISDNTQIVTVWDLKAGRRVLTLQGATGPSNSLAFSPDGRRLACGSMDPLATIWDVSPGQKGEVSTPLHTLKWHGGSFLAVGVAFSPNGRRLATATVDGTVRIWDTRLSREALTLKAGSHLVLWALAFSADGKYLAAASDSGVVAVWEASLR